MVKLRTMPSGDQSSPEAAGPRPNRIAMMSLSLLLTGLPDPGKFFGQKN
jgi:hypothetical protein